MRRSLFVYYRFVFVSVTRRVTLFTFISCHCTIIIYAHVALLSYFLSLVSPLAICSFAFSCFLSHSKQTKKEKGARPETHSIAANSIVNRGRITEPTYMFFALFCRKEEGRESGTNSRNDNFFRFRFCNTVTLFTFICHYYCNYLHT